MCGSTLSGTVSTHVRARRTSPLRVRTSTPSLTRPTDCTGVESHCANVGLRGHRVDQAARPRAERVDAARLLRELEAEAGERVPAQHADGAGVVEVAVRERLELGREHVALLLAQPQFVDAAPGSSARRSAPARRARRADRAGAAARRRRAPRSGPRRAARSRGARPSVRCAARRRRSRRSARRSSLLPMPWPARVSSAQACG